LYSPEVLDQYRPWRPGPKPWWGGFQLELMGFLGRFAPEVRAGALWWALGANKAKVTLDG